MLGGILNAVMLTEELHAILESRQKQNNAHAIIHTLFTTKNPHPWFSVLAAKRDDDPGNC